MESMMGGPLEKLSTSNDPIAVYLMRITPTYYRECSPAQHRLNGTVNGVKETKERCITLNLTAKGQLQMTNHGRVAERCPALESHSYSELDADPANDERQTHFRGKQRVLLIRTSSWLSLAVLLELHKDVSTRDHISMYYCCCPRALECTRLCVATSLGRGTAGNSTF